MDKSLERWREALEQAFVRVKDAPFEERGNVVLRVGHELRALALNLASVECKTCLGFGTRVTQETEDSVHVDYSEPCEDCNGTGMVLDGPDHETNPNLN